MGTMLCKSILPPPCPTSFKNPAQRPWKASSTLRQCMVFQWFKLHSSVNVKKQAHRYQTNQSAGYCLLQSSSTAAKIASSIPTSRTMANILQYNPPQCPCNACFINAILRQWFPNGSSCRSNVCEEVSTTAATPISRTLLQSTPAQKIGYEFLLR